MLRVSVEEKVVQPFVMREVHVRKVWEVLTRTMGVVRVRAECLDGLSRSVDSLVELLSYDNRRGRAIVSLSFRAHSPERNAHCTITYARNLQRPIEISCEGEEESISTLRRELRDINEAMRPWYASVAQLDIAALTIGGGILLVIALVSARALGWVPVPPKTAISEAEKSIQSAKIFGLILLGLVGLGILNSTRDRVFPAGEFTLGEGEERYEVNEKIRWAVVIGFLVSLAASVVVLAV